MNTPSVNPYASPRMLSEPDTPGVYFGTATKKLSFREYWWLAKNPLEFVLGVLFKLLQVNLSATFGIAHPRFLQMLVVDDLPARARERMALNVTQALGLGFQPCLCYTIPHLGPITGFATAMLSSDGTVLIGIGYVHSSAGGVEQEMCKFYFGSYLQDGRVVSTSGGKPDLESPPEVVRESFPNRSMVEVFDRHRQRLREIGSPAIVIRDHGDADRIIRQREERVFDYQCERGVFVPLADHDLKRILASGSNPPKFGSVNPGAGWIGTLSWLVLVLGLYLFFQGPAANQTQWFIRVAILALGVVGVLAGTNLGRRSAAP